MKDTIESSDRCTEVLLIEDNPGDARLLQELLRETGARHVLRRADRLASGLESIGEEPPDVILLDLSLPDSHGIETFQRVLGEAPHIPIILLTGRKGDEIGLAAVRQGAQDYLQKGEVDGKLLVRAIRYAIERARAERAAREGAETLRQFAETVDDVVWLTDWRRRRVIFVNPAYEAIWGRPVERLYDNALDWLEGVCVDDRSRVEEELLREEGPTGGQLDENFRIIRPDGAVRWIHCRFFPIRDAEGAISRMAGIAEDITARKELEAHIVQSQKLESIGELAGGIAHEINTPMQFIGDNVRFLQESIADLLGVVERAGRLLEAAGAVEACSTAARELAESLETADVSYLREEIPAAIEQTLEGVARVSRIVGAMKDFAHPDTADPAPADLNRAIETSVTVARNEWKYVADVITDLDRSLPQVPLLVGEFSQVILAMIVNAAQAIAESIGDRPEEKGTIRITTGRRGDLAEVCISDTGPGIPEAHRSRIFDPFFTTKEVGKGTGQGLAIAHSIIVKKHKGAIEVESEVGKGTTFIIRIPMGSTPSEAGETPPENDAKDTETLPRAGTALEKENGEAAGSLRG